MKKVTVYIATHNRSKLLLRAINSVLAQSYENIEIIVSDDGSTDDTYEKIKQYIDDKLIIYVKNKTPKGACVARNLALSVARGEYITGLDDDDEFTPDRIEKLVKTFESGSYSCVASSILERNGVGDLARQFDCGEITLCSLLHYNMLGNQVLTTTSNLKGINGFDPEMPAFQDYDTWVRLVNKYGKAYKTTDATYIWYTNHNHVRISENNERRLIALELFYHKHISLFKKQHIKSMELLRIRLSGREFRIVDALKLLNVNNYKSVITLYLNRNFYTIKRQIDKWRFR